MSDYEVYMAEQAPAREEMGKWLKKHFRPMQEISGWDSEEEAWIDSNAEIDVALELQEEFGVRYLQRTIDEVAGELVNQYGDWGRPDLAG